MRLIQEWRSLRRYCYRCWRPVPYCLCSSAKSFETTTSFVILMHPREARKERNGTGRLAGICLEEFRIQVGVDFTDNELVNTLIRDPQHAPFLLYPGKKARELSDFPFEELKQKRKRPLLFLLDGTWTAAKKMMRLSRNMHPLPRYIIRAPQPSRFSIRRQPHKSCLSTIESIYYYLEEADKAGLENLEGRHRMMMDILENMVAFQLKCTESSRLTGYRRDISAPLKEQRFMMRKKPRRIFFE